VFCTSQEIGFADHIQSPTMCQAVIKPYWAHEVFKLLM